MRHRPPTASYHASQLKMELAKSGEDVDLFQVNIAKLAAMPSLKTPGIDFGGLSGWHFGYIKGGFDLEANQVLLVVPSVDPHTMILHKDDYYTMWLDPTKLRICGSDPFVWECSIPLLANAATTQFTVCGFDEKGQGAQLRHCQGTRDRCTRLCVESCCRWRVIVVNRS